MPCSDLMKYQITINITESHLSLLMLNSVHSWTKKEKGKTRDRLDLLLMPKCWQTPKEIIAMESLIDLTIY